LIVAHVLEKLIISINSQNQIRVRNGDPLERIVQQTDPSVGFWVVLVNLIISIDSVDDANIKTVNLFQYTRESSEMAAYLIKWDPNGTVSRNTDQINPIGAFGELGKHPVGLIHSECAIIFRVPKDSTKNVAVNVVFDWMNTRNCVAFVARDDIVFAVAFYYTNGEIANTVSTRNGVCLVQNDSSIIKTGGYLSCVDACEGLQFTVFGRLLSGLLGGWCYEQSKQG
jgi:hypothetical protein